ncbi:MAG: 30S ribosomal protein S9 [Candidatus Omnitrophica bacterium CG11_big_fil_rev_8_21_14_0_20_45_26]|uniref:Small ribosomal subunit protein uS9 n=1 Tax=Candidatus Abzuiibacterium crystallinum TaxID=1974748 RepID=A0A2H0LST7_9BACT|nr:MAG: 30S ribosomal protein S9 [Candidatus Omnitrophica bacterium CG11_big_fil_rev_8_21_14_0_20_45_26]PIW63388.1 MAG: 30S ribosomal protein S9 [Candidatus Omnitrophica bacterium CG12_big_fil_rev_8_21_14_0_65_45_16]
MAAKKASKSTFYATGRRKEATARVWLSAEGEKSFSVNGSPMAEYFSRETSRMIVNQPLELSKMTDKFQIKASVTGGGHSGQAGAIRLGISRALLQYQDSLRPSLRRTGLLTRDPREKERKKFGRKGARRSFQFTKR